MKKLMLIAVAILSLCPCFATTPGKEKILTCPECGGKKSVLQLISGNTCGGCQWWDLKTDFPMLPQVSQIQRCPHCGKYYHINHAEQSTGENVSWETGDLTFAQAKEAWTQLKDRLEGKELASLALVYLHTYNDEYQRLSKDSKIMSEGDPKPDEKEMLVSVVYTLLENLEVENPLIHAEFLREAGLFEEALEMVSQAPDVQEALFANFRKYIIDRCREKDSTVDIVKLE